VLPDIVRCCLEGFRSKTNNSKKSLNATNQRSSDLRRGVIDSDEVFAEDKFLNPHESEADRYRVIDPTHRILIGLTDSLYQAFSVNRTNLIKANRRNYLQACVGWLNYDFVGIGRGGDFAGNRSHDRRHAVLICDVVLYYQSRTGFLDFVP